jgi:hypothetical protein
MQLDTSSNGLTVWDQRLVNLPGSIERRHGDRNGQIGYKTILSTPYVETPV